MLAVTKLGAVSSSCMEVKHITYYILIQLSCILQDNVAAFLANLHLSEYEDLFEDEGYFFDKDVANLKHLTESDLLKMGITKRGWWMGYKWEYWSERRVYRRANVNSHMYRWASGSQLLCEMQEDCACEDMPGKAILAQQRASINCDSWIGCVFCIYTVQGCI